MRQRDSLEWARIERVKLVCEVEWEGAVNEILKDFLKLCVISSDIKLYIHSNEYYDNERKSNIVDVCKSVLTSFKRDRFLFVGIGKDEFRIDLCIT